MEGLPASAGTAALARPAQRRRRVQAPRGARPPPRYAFIVVRPCDLSAIGVQDRVFTCGEHGDSDCRERRRQAFLLVVHGTEPGGTCFCASMGTGPTANAGFDIAMTEIVDGGQAHYLVEAGSERGAEVLDEPGCRPASEDEIAEGERRLGEAAGDPDVREARKPKLAVWELASCEGYQLTLFDCEDELLTVAGALAVAYFLEASSAVAAGPYDISLVEGSITNLHGAERIRQVHEVSNKLVVIGACATAGGIQAMRNFAGSDGGPTRPRSRRPSAHTPSCSTCSRPRPDPEHVLVDFELRGCPIAKDQLLELVSATLADRKPQIPGYALCLECKRRGVPCAMVATGQPCLDPATQAGCGWEAAPRLSAPPWPRRRRSRQRPPRAASMSRRSPAWRARERSTCGSKPAGWRRWC